MKVFATLLILTGSISGLYLLGNMGMSKGNIAGKEPSSYCEKVGIHYLGVRVRAHQNNLCNG